jgi:Raf kinase inhibitor-like YbhB/YbcL family protein
MELSSPAFSPNGPIPARYTCDGADVSPELRVEGIPEGAAALVLIMDDPDAPGRTWDHWVAYDIEPVERIEQGVGNVGTGGVNSWKKTGYGGPCPPSGTHRYFFKVLALDEVLGLGEGEDKATVLAATVGHVLAEATLMGTYAR